MRRRSFLTSLGAAAFVAGAAPTLGTRRALAAPDRIAPLTFDSTASLLAADRDELTDESVVAVWAEDTAENVDEDGDDDAVIYDDTTPIPLVAADDGVVGFGAPIAQNDTDFLSGNEEFVLNVLDAEVGGSDDAPATVLFDYGHDQFYGPWTFEAFIAYAEENGYDFEWSDDLTTDYADADAAVITSPATGFTADELDALRSFVADGGSLLLFDQSDFGDYDATANLNDIAAELGLAFRFNDDQVIDETNNAGVGFVPQTTNFNTRFDYFTDRDGLGFELDADETYTVEVVDVTDGDTVDVRFEGGQEEAVRVLGIDTAEKPRNRSAERAEEWEGIDSYDYLGEWGERATTFAQGELSAGDTVDLRFDGNESVRDAFGRLLGYVYYDGDDSGARDTLYNRRAVEEGFARVYDSGFEFHDSFLRAELAARDSGLNVWTDSDPENSTEIRNGPVEAIFAPRAASVRTSEGAVDDKRVPVYAAPTATQERASVEYDEIPLVGVDHLARVAVVGSPLVDESYEAAEGFPIDTSDYGNFAFLTSLVDRLSDREGDVLIDGGHGQFGVDYALSAEDAAYYQRYLEGIDIGFEGVNDLTSGLLDRARALLVTSPVTAYTDEELAALQSFVDDGGAVVLLGGDVPAAARENLNAVADALCTDLRVSDGAVVDDASNLDGDASVPVTANFDEWFRLFDGYDADASYKGARGGPGRPGCHGRRRGDGQSSSEASGRSNGKAKGKRKGGKQ
ncbi:Gldg family protein [Haloprofundus marisrubri]|uniref:Gldg family protein n=1 Tax=Haloprofundus marisrubri TaxID=1514971 RepID=UPI0008F92D54|nr:DUF4350 domain-containing protein [Haloprofundus marisrubri]